MEPARNVWLELGEAAAATAALPDRAEDCGCGGRAAGEAGAGRVGAASFVAAGAAAFAPVAPWVFVPTAPRSSRKASNREASALVRRFSSWRSKRSRDN